MNKLVIPNNNNTVPYFPNFEIHGIIHYGWAWFSSCRGEKYQKYYIFDTEENMNLFKMKYLT